MSFFSSRVLFDKEQGTKMRKEAKTRSPSLAASTRSLLLKNGSYRSSSHRSSNAVGTATGSVGRDAAERRVKTLFPSQASLSCRLKKNKSPKSSSSTSPPLARSACFLTHRAGSHDGGRGGCGAIDAGEGGARGRARRRRGGATVSLSHSSSEKKVKNHSRERESPKAANAAG